jgi:hypothetical protein
VGSAAIGRRATAHRLAALARLLADSSGHSWLTGNSTRASPGGAHRAHERVAVVRLTLPDQIAVEQIEHSRAPGTTIGVFTLTILTSNDSLDHVSLDVKRYGHENLDHERFSAHG